MRKRFVFSLTIGFFLLWQFNFNLDSKDFSIDSVSAATSKSPAALNSAQGYGNGQANENGQSGENENHAEMDHNGTQEKTWSSNPSSWATEGIEKAKGYGLTVDSLLDDYDKPIDREEFVQLIMKHYAAAGGVLPSDSESLPFHDTSDENVAYAYALGIVSGAGNDQFNPTGELTRQEAAVMLYREWVLLNGDTNLSSSEAAVFADADQIATWAREAIQFMNQNKIMQGASDGSLNPTANTTREQAMLLILRSYQVEFGLESSDAVNELEDSIETDASVDGTNTEELDDTDGTDDGDGTDTLVD